MAAAVPSLSPEAIQDLLNSPAGYPPDGEVANLDNPPMPLQNAIIATQVLAITFTTTFTMVRMYTRAFIIRTVGWEDVLCVLAWMSFMAFVGLCFVTQGKTGIHSWNLRIRDVIFLLQWVNYIEIVYSIIIISVKCSILLQYRRIFVPTRQTSPVLYYGIWFMFFATIIFYVIIMFLEIFQCVPREAIWNIFLPGKCINVNSILIAGASFNLASDVIIFLLPQPAIWSLRMSVRRKIGMSVIFGLGGLACVVTALRVQSTMQVINTLDISWYFGPLGLWCICEVSFAIIACSLPTIPKFVQTCRKRLAGESRSSGYVSSGADPVLVAEEGKAVVAKLVPKPHGNMHQVSAPDSIQIGSTYLGTWYNGEASPTRTNMAEIRLATTQSTVRGFSRPLTAEHRPADAPAQSHQPAQHSTDQPHLADSLERAIHANRAAQSLGRPALYDGYQDYISQIPDGDEGTSRTTRRGKYEYR